jgi:hypothetical protein
MKAKLILSFLSLALLGTASVAVQQTTGARPRHHDDPRQPTSTTSGKYFAITARSLFSRSEGLATRYDEIADLNLNRLILLV